MSTHVIPQGTTEYQEFLLKDTDQDGVVTAPNLTGVTLGIEITDKDGTAVVTGAGVGSAGTVSIVTAATAHVRFAPTGVTLTKASSPYRVRWTNTASGRLFKVPNGLAADVWQVVLP